MVLLGLPYSFTLLYRNKETTQKEKKNIITCEVDMRVNRQNERKRGKREFEHKIK
jgi:hypothetical protein